MPVLIELTKFRVRSLDVSFNEVSWEVAETSEDILDYSFQILRSESPSGPYDTLTVPFGDRYFFIDNNLKNGHRWRKYYYLVRVVQLTTGDTLDFGPVTHEPDADILAIELRRHMQLLFHEYAGRRMWALVKRTFGQRCFLPGTPIQGAVIGASRAVYKGKTIQVTTKKGFCLTVTSNHPVLTPQGFVPAKSLRVGDDLVCYGREPWVSSSALRSEGDEQKKPALAEDVFRALSERLHSKTTRAVGLDFHGEAQSFVGDVEVVGSYGNLLLNEQPHVLQHPREIVLEQSPLGEIIHGGHRTAKSLLQGDYSPTRGFVRSLDLKLSQSRFSSTPHLVLRFGHPAQANSPLLECVTNDLTGNSALVGELVHRGAGLVALDQIADIREDDYLGHVFDFETTTGWVIASDIFTSNCECYDKVLMKRTRSGCRLCYDTSFVRGYMSPIEVYGQIDPAPKSEQQTNVGKQQQVNSSGRLGYYPALKPDDLLIEAENRRWRVVTVTMTEQGRAPVHQEISIHEIPSTDIEFLVPLNLDRALKDLFISPARNFSNPTNLENFEAEQMPNVFALYDNTTRSK